MDFTVSTRKKNVKNFVKNFKYVAGYDIDYDLLELFNSKYLARGVEGKTYKSKFKDIVSFSDDLVIKDVDLYAMRETKTVTKLVLRLNSKELMKLFQTSRIFNKPSFVEIISQTLTNQLIFQKISPQYPINFHWDFRRKHLYLLNEFISFSDFDHWARKKWSFEIWCNALFQLMYGCAVLKRYFNMLHVDLHTKNILVHKVKPGGYWTYNLDGKKYYLPNLGFVFLLNDFGFSYIPKKLRIAWYYMDYLKYLTTTGLHFYDMSIFFDSLMSKRSYKIPKDFTQLVKNNFTPSEIFFVYKKEFYKHGNKYDKNLYKQYPTKGNIDTGTTLSSKIKEIFYNENNKVHYKHKPSGKLIDAYSADKSFDTAKLPSNFRNLVV